MPAIASSSPRSNPPQDMDQLLSQGDARWNEAQPPQWRERAVALPWPPSLLDAFGARMALHGLAISRALMLSDRRYALQQLVHAHQLKDDALSQLAVQLFRHFEAHQAGLRSLH